MSQLKNEGNKITNFKKQVEEKYNLAEMLLIKERKQSLISKLYLVLNAATSINFTPLFLNLLISVLSPN